MKKYKYGRILFPLWITTCIWGLINLFSASYMFLIRNDMNPFRYVLVQGIIFLVCAISMYVFIKITKVGGYYFMKRSSRFLFFFTMLTLVAVLIIGEDRGGAKSVIDLIVFDFQPMELFKVTVILYLAYIFDKCQSNQASLLDLLKQLALPILGIGLIFMQPDLGGAIICSMVILISVLLNGRFVGRILKWLLGIIVTTVLVLIVLPSTILGGYQIDRINNWLDPFADAQDASYQTVQSLIGISNGGISGVGYMNSLQKTFLDAGAATDYIFIVICEEWGLFGAVLTIALLVAIAYICISIGLRATERYGQIFATTYGALILVQTFVNIGGVINLIPMTGVTLPFISNGMNSLIFLSAGILGCILIDVKSTTDKNKLKEMNFRIKQQKLEDKLREDRRNKNLSNFGGK